MSPLRILVVDDSSTLRDLVAKILSSDGHVVTAAQNGHEALDFARKQSFDLAITDMIMPDGDGAELIMNLWKVSRAIRVIAMSGGGDHLSVATCVRIGKGLGAHAILVKPFTPEGLRSAVAAAMVAPPPIWSGDRRPQ